MAGCATHWDRPAHDHVELEQADVELASWPEAYYVIVSLEDKVEPVIRAFRITDGEVTEEELRVA